MRKYGSHDGFKYIADGAALAERFHQELSV